MNGQPYGIPQATEDFPCQTSLGRLLEEYNVSTPAKWYSGDSENNRNQSITENPTPLTLFINNQIIQVNDGWEGTKNWRNEAMKM